jgi:hypothetical protein
MHSRPSPLRLFCHLIVVVALLIVLPASLPAVSAATRARVATAPIDVQSIGVSAADAPAIEFVDNLGGIMGPFVVSGTTIYLIQGGGLTVLDVSVPAAPVRVGHTVLLSDAVALAMTDEMLYVVSSDRLQIIDVHNRVLPTEIARYTPHASTINAIQVTGGYAYLKTRRDGFEIVDVRTPTRPLYAATYAHAPRVADFFVAGGVAYVVDGTDVLTIVDLSDPGAPTKAGTFTVSSPVQTVLFDLTVQGQRVYISAVMSDFPSYPGLVTLDITHPTAPVLLGNVRIASYSVTFVGNVGYLQDPMFNGLWILDMSDPSNPITHGLYQGDIVRTAGQEFVQVVGDRAYLMEQFQTLKIVDATNLDIAVVLGVYSTPPGLKDPFQIQIAGDTAYVLSQGLQALDITNPVSPTLRGYYPFDFAWTLQVVGVHAYLGRSWGELALLDISDPDQPALLSTMTVSAVQAVAEAANRAYILTVTEECVKFCTVAHHALAIFDISNPAAPQLLSRTQLFDSSGVVAGGIAVSGKYTYIAWGDTLRIMDVGDSAAPVVRASLPIAAGVNFMQVVGDLAYMVGQGGLSVVSLTDPLKPALLGRTGSLGEFVYSIQVQDSLAFVGTSSGVRVVDIAEPRRPFVRASYGDTLGPVRAKGDTIYVAVSSLYLGRSSLGLYVLRLHSDRFPSPMFVPLARH